MSLPRSRKTRLSVHLPFAWLAAAWPFLLGCGPAVQVDQRPNILWISAEDLSPNLGSYGDEFASTPNLDRFAGQSLRFTNVFTTAPVCAPSRSAIITGMYATSIGTMHMRTAGGAPYHPENLIGYQAVPPPDVKCFTEYLRAAGYYCVNNHKTDYQFGLPFTAWDESSREAHWRKRPPGKPFFAVFNLGETHESSNWEQENEQLVHDPDKVAVAPYYPDTPKVRRNLARYYDNIARMDRRFEEILGQLEEDGLTDNTIVWFWGDHGAGLPRGKYWLYDSGVRVPLLIRWPGRLEPASKEELVSGIDFAPTLLSLLGLKIPDHMQGRAFLGSAAGAPREYVFSAGDRQDETYHRIRSVRDRRYKYIRNYLPEQSYADGLVYKEKMPIMQELRRLAAAGQLDPAQQLFLSDAKPPEELYDLEVDPHEIMNLVASRQHEEVLQRLRAEHERWKEQSKDLGAVPEMELIEQMWPGGKQPHTQMPEIHVSAGPSEDSVKVRLTCPTEGASIGFATGKDEHPAWQLYAGELTLPRGTTVRARAIRYGYEPSGVVEATSPSAELLARAAALELDSESVPPPGKALDHHTAGFAKILCSALFISGLEPDFAVENIGYFTSPYEERAKVTKRRIDYENKAVHLTLPSGITRTAKYYGDQGCVALPIGKDSVYFTPVEVESALADASTQAWPKGDVLPDEPLPADLDTDKVKAAVDAAFEPPQGLTAAFVVTWKGRIIGERYRKGIDLHTALESWSMGKSLTATLMGVLIQQGVYDLWQPAPIPQWQKEGDPRHEIRIADILRMSSGLRFRSPLDPDFDPALGYTDHRYVYTGTVNSFEWAAARPLQWPPNTVGRYRNSDPVLINFLIRLAVEGRGEDYLSFPQRALFDKLGSRDMVLETDPYGNFLTQGYEFGSGRDWARLGNLYLKDGVWNGERILPEGYAKFVSTVAPAWEADGRPIYGAFFWINLELSYPIPKDAYYMAGAGNQKTFIIPSHDLVVVRLGHYKGASPGNSGLKNALALLMETIPESR